MYIPYPVHSLASNVSFRVLIIDTDCEAREQLATILVEDGLVGNAVDSCGSALRWLPEYQPHLVLLDAHTAHLDQSITCAHLRAMCADAELRIVLMTTIDDSDSVEYAIADGVDDILFKPVHAAVLRIRVRHLLAARVQAQTLKDTQAHLRRVFDDGIIGMALMTKDGRYHQVNDALCTLLGYTQDELIGMHFLEVTHPDDRETASSLIPQNPSKLAETLHREQRTLHKDGSIIWCHVSAAVVYDSDKNQAYIACQYHDISARKATETALGESEARFRTLFEQSPDGIILIDPHDPSGTWPIVDCNASYCAMNGYTRAEVLGQSIDLVNPGPDFFDPGTTHLDRIRAAGTLKDQNVQRRKDGTLITVEYSTTLVVVDGRELILGIDRETTARARVEETLRFQANLLDTVGQAVIATSLDGTITYWNRHAEVIYGQSSATVLGQNIAEVIPTDLSLPADRSDPCRTTCRGTIIRRTDNPSP